MGGALAVHTAIQNSSCCDSQDDSIQNTENNNIIRNLVGICVIDVVEGTAMDALSSMQSFLRSRPKSFPSLEYAIEWAVRSGQVRNLESARVSMPGQLKDIETGSCSTKDVHINNTVTVPTNIESTKPKFIQQISDSILEEPEINKNNSDS